MIPKKGIPSIGSALSGLSDKMREDILKEESNLNGFSDKINDELRKSNESRNLNKANNKKEISKVKLPSIDLNSKESTSLQSSEDYVEIAGKKLKPEQISKLRETKRWKTYFNTLRARDSKGNVKAFPKVTSAAGMNEEDYKRYIDKMVLTEVDSRNPGKTFDNFYRTFKK